MSIKLQEHQEAVLEHFISNKDIRGMLLYHGTGSGKTLSAIAIAERFKYFPEVILIAPKSLHDNFRKDLKRYTHSKAADRYKFISSNSANMITKLETDIDDISGLSIKSLRSLDNKFIILDEAHRLLNGMVNGSKNATQLYDLLMKARNCKILFLTASAVVNNVYEPIVCLNICKGYIRSEDGINLTLFSENQNEFIKYFVDIEKMTLKNVDKLRNRMLGLVSYVGEMFDLKVESFYSMLKRTISKEHYPDRLPIKIELVPMSPIQYGAYAMAREKERLETKQAISGGVQPVIKSMQFLNQIKGGELTKSSAFSKSTSYRIKSRQLSNIYFPDDSETDIYADMQTYSPKICMIGKKIKKGRKAIIYSNFVQAGVMPMSKYLETLGYNNFDPNTTSKSGENGYYGLYSGDVSTEDRTSILNEFNKTNSDLTVLLISSSGAEGLSTKGARNVHIMEPYWNWERSLQVMARAIRYYSHEHLPEDERNVKVYIYLSDYPAEQKQKNASNPRTEFPTDVYLFTESVKKYEINIQMTKLLASTAVDCSQFNKKLNFECYQCNPKDGSPVFLPDLDKDMLYESPCGHQHINVKEFKLSGSLYYIDSTGRIYSKKDDKYIEIIDPDVLAYIKAKMPSETP
jgi:SNF2 family DNA or RNA helicase